MEIKRWNDKNKNPCQGRCQGKGWVLDKDGQKDACPDCHGTELGPILTPTPNDSSTYKVTAR